MTSVHHEDGKTLAELLLSLTLTGVVMAAAYDLMIIQNRLFSAQDQSVDAEQTARMAMTMITRELHMAGYSPVMGVSLTGITYDPARLRIRADLNGNGTTADANEDITYSYDAPKLQLIRSGNGAQTVFKNIQAFSVSYLDANGIPTTISADIRAVSVKITGRTERPDPTYTANNGYRTFTLQARVMPRNLGL
ncbi:MAG: PilW family protein [Nitrospiraceae bacterium]